MYGVNVYTPPQAYTLSVVVSVLQKIGPPPSLKALPEPGQGRCVVTLAVVLSSITNLLLNKALAAHRERHERRATLPNQVGESSSAEEIKLHASSFYERWDFLEVSPVANLRKYEFDWWQKFVGLLTRSINETLKRRLHKIAFRDPHVLKAIQEAKEAGRHSPSGTWAHVYGKLAEFDRTASYPATKTPMEDLARKWKQRFEEEDRATEEWITKTGGSDHPHNIYNSVCQQRPDLFWVPLSEIPLTREDSEEVQRAKKEILKARRAKREEALGKIPLQQLEAQRQKEQLLMELFDALGGKIDHAFVKPFPVTRPRAVRHGDSVPG
jgi:hypothetical protein